MCINCYNESRHAEVINNLTIKGAKLIDDVYSHEENSCGGYGHIVFDDWNLNDSDIEYCLKDAEENKYAEQYPEPARQSVIAALKYMATLSIAERYSAMGIQSGFSESYKLPKTITL